MNETMKIVTPTGVVIVEMDRKPEGSNVRLEYMKAQFGFLSKGLALKHKIKFHLDSLTDTGTCIAAAFRAERDDTPVSEVSLQYPHSRLFHDETDDKLLFDSMAAAVLLSFSVISRQSHSDVVELVHIGRQQELI